MYYRHACAPITITEQRYYRMPSNTLSTHLLNTPFHRIISIRPLNLSSQPILLPYQFILSTYPLNTPFQSTHPLNPPILSPQALQSGRTRSFTALLVSAASAESLLSSLVVPPKVTYDSFTTPLRFLTSLLSPHAVIDYTHFHTLTIYNIIDYTIYHLNPCNIQYNL